MEFIHHLLSGITIGLNQQFGQGDGGCYGLMARTLDPLEYGIGELYITRICFQLIYEDVRVERDPVVSAKKSSEGG